MHQPTPNVTIADLNRVIRRDFTDVDHAAAMSILKEYGTETWHREDVRAKLAVLKLAQGDIKKLREYIDVAKSDYRDVLAMAEYPGYMDKTCPPNKSSAQEQKKVIDEDWKQYSAWLSK